MGRPQAREDRPKPSPPSRAPARAGVRTGARLSAAPRTCGVAVAGLAGCPLLPAVVVLLAALTVGPGRVVAAVAAVAPVPAAAVQLPVIEALV